MNREEILRRRIKLLTSFFILGLFLSGATAIPLRIETDWLTRFSDTPWLMRVHAALAQTQSQCPFLFYGTDWLAFGHFMIAIAFIGALKDPVRNRWLFDFGLIACALVIPWALIFGAVRGIPFWWRLIDCSFGIFGFIPLWLCRIWAKELEVRKC
ncbi:MAG TPA: hypothetical protein VMF08_23295 [Candidatus Sulfotelmatobacter sp.]|nr:hypothetical protein [Candidatus Sulfotelmatobacter sp.]